MYFSVTGAQSRCNTLHYQMRTTDHNLLIYSDPWTSPSKTCSSSAQYCKWIRPRCARLPSYRTRITSVTQWPLRQERLRRVQRTDCQPITSPWNENLKGLSTGGYVSQDNVKLLLGETLAFAGHTTALTWPQQ